MENIDNIMQLCRLCLVKEQVNIPIFGQNNDLEEISAKIRSCLPVKVSPDDSLPKKICDGCSYKLDLLYVFRNTSINSEKQLYQWLEQAGISKTTAATATTMSTPSVTATTIPTTPAVPSTDPIIPTIPATNTTALDNIVNDAITKSEISVKQEKSDSTAGSELSAETQEYLLQQQKLPYQESFGDFNTETNSAEPEEPARKKLRRAAASKPPIKDNESDPDMPPTKAEDDSDEDMDDMGDGGMDDDDDEDEEEEEDGLDHPEFVDVPSTSAEEQPGPSGVNKDPIAAPFTTTTDSCYLLNEFERVTPSTPLQCAHCQKICKYKSDLKRHLQTHFEYRPHYCNICKKAYKRKETLNKHRCLNDTTKHECNICGKQLNSYDGLKIHHLRHLKQFKNTCDICGFGCMSESELKTHISGKHQGNRVYRLCNICGQSITGSHLKQHMRLHEDGEKRNFECEYCTKSFKQELYLRQHIKRQHNNSSPKYACDVCDKVLTTAKGLRTHKLIHDGVKPNVCNYCEKKFTSRSVLVTHIRTHSGEKPYVCHICQKAFTQRSPLMRHVRQHTGEKPYSCDHCNVKFVDKSALSLHQKNKH